MDKYFDVRTWVKHPVGFLVVAVLVFLLLPHVITAIPCVVGGFCVFRHYTKRKVNTSPGGFPPEWSTWTKEQKMQYVDDEYKSVGETLTTEDMEKRIKQKALEMSFKLAEGLKKGTKVGIKQMLGLTNEENFYVKYNIFAQQKQLLPNARPFPWSRYASTSYAMKFLKKAPEAVENKKEEVKKNFEEMKKALEEMEQA